MYKNYVVYYTVYEPKHIKPCGNRKKNLCHSHFGASSRPIGLFLFIRGRGWRWWLAVGMGVRIVVIVMMVVVIVMVTGWYVHFVGIVVRASLGRNLACQRVQAM